jgi:cytochrome P450
MNRTAQAKFEFDPFSPEVAANPDPYFKELRDNHPVYYSDQYDTYFFSRFNDVWEILRVGDNTFLATETNLPTAQYLRTHRNAAAPALASINPMAPGPKLHSPYYEEMRRAHIAPLQPKGVAALRAFISELTRNQLDQMLPRCEFDLSADYAAIVPAKVICHLFGLPAEAADEILRAIGDIGRYKPGKQGVDLTSFFTKLQHHIVPAIQARRKAGADGSNRLYDGLINYRMEPNQRKLSDGEIADQLVCAMVGGMESVPKVTARGIMELHARPDQLAAVRSDLDKNVPIAAEEMLRYCAPAQYTFRTAHKNTVVAGQRVKAGQRVACMLYSASRDDREFDNPDEFIWNRPIPRVLSFGLGQHHCIGRHLAQLEVRTLAHEFLSRVNNFEFAAQEAGLNQGYFQRGWISLPVIIRD